MTSEHILKILDIGTISYTDHPVPSERGSVRLWRTVRSLRKLIGNLPNELTKYGTSPIMKVAVVAALILVLAVASYAQEELEGKIVKKVQGTGFNRNSFSNFRDMLQTRQGRPFKHEAIKQDVEKLWKKQLFSDISYSVERDTQDDQLIVTFEVIEYGLIKDMQIKGAKAISTSKITERLRLKSLDSLNPYYLKLDKEDIQRLYYEKGYHFATVQEVIEGTDEMTLIWQIFEGPEVTVDEIKFSGRCTLNPSDIKDKTITKENGFLTWKPFIYNQLITDIERIKLYYRFQGFLDIYTGNRVYIEDIEFNEEKDKVTITIFIDEPVRYYFRNIQIEGAKEFKQEELYKMLTFKSGAVFSEDELWKSAQRIKETYGERGFFDTQVDYEWILVKDTNLVDIIFDIKEGGKTIVGKIIFEGNTKTREDRLRIEFKELNPGSEFDLKKLSRGISRLRDKGWFKYEDGVKVEYKETDLPNIKDIVVKLEESRTALLQMSAGYSSNFGVLGLFEFSQRNFDLADLPESFSDIPESFQGGGQALRLRLMPAAKRQSYSINFREPYIFGNELGLSTSFFKVFTIREAWDEDILGGSLSFDKRWDNLTVALEARGNRAKVSDLTSLAPDVVRRIQGTSTIISIGPAVAYDVRDSVIIPTEGYRFDIGYEISDNTIGSDYDFGRFVFEVQNHIPIYETEAKSRHVYSTRLKFGLLDKFTSAKPVPIFEKFFLGGRGSIRGFRYRGVGPRQFNIPIGGDSILTVMHEYTIPFYQKIIFGALFYDIGSIVADVDDYPDSKFRNVVGFGFRFVVPNLGNVPITLDFGFVLSKEPQDREQTVLFDIGSLIF